MEELTNRIRQLRKERHISQKELAKALSITQGAVSKWERNAAEPTIPLLISLANFFNCTIDFLVGREN